MENMSSIFVNIYSFNVFAINIPSYMIPFVNY